MPSNAKRKKGFGQALIEAVGFLSFLLGLVVLLTIAFGTIGGMFMSTKRLFQVKRVKSDKYKSQRERESKENKRPKLIF